MKETSLKFGLSDQTIQLMHGVFAQYPQVDKVVIYGSRAKGNYKNGSDIDLTLFGSDLSYRVQMDVFDALDELLLPYMIDLSIFDQLDNAKLKEHIERVGVVFYQRETMKQGWEVKKLGDLCNLMTGGTPSRSKEEYFKGGTIKWLVSGDIHKREIFDCEGRITELGMANSNAKLLPINSVMIALNGQGKTRGTVALLKTNATCNQSLVSIYPKDIRKILPEFIFCNLHGRYEEIRKITGDDNNDRRGLNMPLIRNIEIPLPPLHEQQRIVKKLDALQAETKKLEVIYQKKINDLEELKKSILQKAFRGEL
jgi:restriction endonuclease S subunit